MVRVSSPAKLRPWSELIAKMVMGVVPGLVRKACPNSGRRLFCSDGTVAVAMRFAMKSGQMSCSLRKFLVISSAIQKIASDCGCDAVLPLSFQFFFDFFGGEGMGPTTSAWSPPDNGPETDRRFIRRLFPLPCVCGCVRSLFCSLCILYIEMVSVC